MQRQLGGRLVALHLTLHLGFNPLQPHLLN
jgi:hypothetical protein